MNMTTFREIQTTRKWHYARAYFTCADVAERFCEMMGNKTYMEQTANEKGFVVYYLKGKSHA